MCGRKKASYIINKELKMLLIRFGIKVQSGTHNTNAI